MRPTRIVWVRHDTNTIYRPWWTTNEYEGIPPRFIRPVNAVQVPVQDHLMPQPIAEPSNDQIDQRAIIQRQLRQAAQDETMRDAQHQPRVLSVDEINQAAEPIESPPIEAQSDIRQMIEEEVEEVEMENAEPIEEIIEISDDEDDNGQCQMFPI